MSSSSSGKIRVALVFGGKSGEHEVSVVSALAAYKALDPNKYEVTLVGIDRTGRWLLPEKSFLLANAANPRLGKLEKERAAIGLLPYKTESQVISVAAANAGPVKGMAFDVVVPILHGTHGEDGTIQGFFELAGLPYVGSGVLGSAVGMDKDMTKRVLRDAGIPVVPFFALRATEFRASAEAALERAEKTFGYPYFVKPANTGSSLGVGKVKSKAEARAKFTEAFLYDAKVLVERGVEARELECAVLGNDRPEASVIGEIAPTHEFYSYEAKYIDEKGADLHIPAKNLPADVGERIREMAVQAFLALELSGMARVDFFLDKKTGELFLNEVNTIPGFTPISMYPKLWEASGVPYAKLFDRLIELALERHAQRAGLKTDYEVKT